MVEVKKMESCDWDDIVKSTSYKSESPFRNGVVESFVNYLKTTMKVQYRGRKITMMENLTSFELMTCIMAHYGRRKATQEQPDFLQPLTPKRDKILTNKPLRRLHHLQESLSAK